MSAERGPITSAVGLSLDALVPVTAEDMDVHVMTSPGQSSHTVIEVPVDMQDDGKVVVNLEDYRRDFRKTVCDAFGVEPQMVGLTDNYYFHVAEVRIGDEVFQPRWGELSFRRRGLWFWKLWFHGKRVAFAEWLYVHVSGQDFPKDW